MADTERENRAQADIHAFLQRRRLKLKREYLSRGRRFANLNDEQLTENWIAAVRTWLARKGPVTELAMDDLTAELRLRGFEPPYDAMNRELAARFFEFNKAAQKKVATRFARHLTAFLGQRDKLLH